MTARGPAPPRGREAPPAHPPAPVDDTTSGSLEQRPRTHRRPQPASPGNRRPPQDRDLGPGARQGPSAGAALTPRSPPSPRSTPSPTTTPRPTTSPPFVSTPTPTPPVCTRRPSGDCSAAPPPGWRVRPTSVELYHALRADNPTTRQRSIATVFINETSFEDLVNAHTEGAFTWGQLARAARRQDAVPPRRIRLINAFAITSARRHAPAIPARRGRASPPVPTPDSMRERRTHPDHADAGQQQAGAFGPR